MNCWKNRKNKDGIGGLTEVKIKRIKKGDLPNGKSKSIFYKYAHNI